MLPLSVNCGFMGLLLGPFGVQELMIILLIAVLVFGGRKIPEIGRGLGEGIRQFKDSLKDGKETNKEDETAKTPSSSV